MYAVFYLAILLKSMRQWDVVENMLAWETDACFIFRPDSSDGKWETWPGWSLWSPSGPWFHYRNITCQNKIKQTDEFLNVHSSGQLSLLTVCVLSSQLFKSLSHVRLCDSMNCSMPGFSVHYYLPELAQTHVHWVSDAIQPSHPLSPPPPLALSFSQHQGLFQWVGSLKQVAKLLELQLQYQSFQWIFRVDFL